MSFSRMSIARMISFISSASSRARISASDSTGMTSSLLGRREESCPPDSLRDSLLCCGRSGKDGVVHGTLFCVAEDNRANGCGREDCWREDVER